MLPLEARSGSACGNIGSLPSHDPRSPFFLYFIIDMFLYKYIPSFLFCFKRTN